MSEPTRRQAVALLKASAACLRTSRAARAFGCACLAVAAGCGQTAGSSSQVSLAPDAAVGGGAGGGLGGAHPSGGGSSSGGAGDSAPPAWQPYFDLGSPGWRSSVEPLCTDLFGGMAQAVWSDEGGVFALVSAICGHEVIPCGGQGTSLYGNDGTGWVAIQNLDPGLPSGSENAALSGFPGGDLIVYQDSCGISFVSWDGGSSPCLDNGVTTVRAFGNQAYAVAGDQVLAYDGTSQWNLLATLPDVPTFGTTDLWAGADSLVVVGEDYTARVDLSGVVEALPGVPAGNYWAVWAFDAHSNVWLASAAGQLVHFDGLNWSVVDTGMTNPIRGLWGSPEGVLYFYGQRDFGRWNGTAIERFIVDPGSSDIYISSMWGNHTNEVFLAVIDQSFREHPCSGVFTLYFDGAELHPF